MAILNMHIEVLNLCMHDLESLLYYCLFMLYVYNSIEINENNGHVSKQILHELLAGIFSHEYK